MNTTFSTHIANEGESVMFWTNGSPVIGVVTGHGSKKVNDRYQHAIIVEVDGAQYFVTKEQVVS